MANQPTYHYMKKAKRRKRRWPLVLLIFLLILAIAGLLIYLDLQKNQQPEIAGEAQIINTEADDSVIEINEKTFSIKLPSDWKKVEFPEYDRVGGTTWQATKAYEDNRYLTIYVDDIPAQKGINRLVPVEAKNSGLIVGNISENCVSFTKGGTMDAREAVKRRETPAKWENVDFICDLPRPFGNVIAAGSKDGINQVKVTGATQGEHRYFFVYVDHNKQSNIQLFLNALKTFKAK